MNLIHLVNVTMTLLALNLTHFYVLRVVEINVVRQVVNLHPWYWP